MSFQDLTKQHYTFATGHVLGQAVEYKKHGSAIWASFTARAKSARDEFGNAMANSIQIEVSKAFVATASPAHDLFRLPAENVPGQWWPVYTLREIRDPDKSSGGYRLICVAG